MCPDPFFSIQNYPHKIRAGWFSVSLALLLLVSLEAACSLNRGSSTPGVPATTVAGAVTDPAIGLGGLSSYRATLHLSFDGTRDGTPLAWSQDLLLESDQAASARLLTIDRQGPDAGQAVHGMLIGQFGVMSLYQPAADEACQADSGNTALAIPEPARLLRSIQKPLAFDSSPQEKNGISTLHAIFGPPEVGAGSQAKGTGEIWIAQNGGYILRYSLEMNGSADDWGKGIEGVMRWDYNLEQVGQPLGLLPPMSCPLGMVDAPLPEDAAKVESKPGILTFTSSLDLAAAAQFYRDRLSARGWNEVMPAFLSSRAARLVFTQPDRQLIVHIRAGSPGTVQINLERIASVQPQSGTSATPGPQPTRASVSPTERVVSALNNLLGTKAAASALPSYHLESTQLRPVWSGEKINQSQESMTADVQGKNVHFIDRTAEPGKPAKVSEAYLLGDQEYDVRDGQLQPAGPGLASLAWTLWPLDPIVVISTGSIGAKAVGIEELEGRSVEAYELSGTGSSLGGLGGIGLPVTSVSGKVWVDGQTGALLKADLEYQAEVRDTGGTAQGNDSGSLKIDVTRIGNVTVTLPNQ